jgi:hypothetical protein
MKKILPGKNGGLFNSAHILANSFCCLKWFCPRITPMSFLAQTFQSSASNVRDTYCASMRMMQATLRVGRKR